MLYIFGSYAKFVSYAPKNQQQCVVEIGSYSQIGIELRTKVDCSPSFKNREMEFSKSRQKIPPNDVKSFGSNMGVKS